jgi:hypothetical protein
MKINNKDYGRSRALVAHICHLNYSGGSQFEDSLGKQFTEHYLENTQHKKCWPSGSSGRAPA